MRPSRFQENRSETSPADGSGRSRFRGRPPAGARGWLWGLLCALVLSTASTAPGAMLLSDARLAELRAAVASGTEPTATAWVEVKRAADLALNRDPLVPEEWFVPGYYANREAHQRAKEGLMQDANDAYALALAFRLTGDARYALQSKRLIQAWAGLKKTRTEADSMLSFSYHFPPLIFAADLLRGSPHFSREEDDAFGRFLQETALPMNTMRSGNNWGNWGLVLFSAIASYREDTAALATARKRWEQFIDSQIAEDGTLPHEIGRNGGRSGLHYSHFCLGPQTLAAEILRCRGIDLYDYVSPRGRTLRSAYETVAPWALRPETFPRWKGDPKELHGADRVSYFELLLPRWPNPDAAALVKARRPLTSRHGLPFLTFTHGQALP